MARDSKLMRGDKPFLFTNCRTGEGIAELVALIRNDLLFDLKLPAGRLRMARPGGGARRAPRVRALLRRAAADGQRCRRQVRPPAPRLRAPGRAHDPGQLESRAPCLAQRALHCDDAFRTWRGCS